MESSSTSEAEVTMRILGTDPWLRFDLWANRAWEASERASDLAMVNGPPVNADDDLDHRIIALFHSAAIAKEFAEMVNPLFVVSDSAPSSGSSTTERYGRAVGMIADTEEQG